MVISPADFSRLMASIGSATTLPCVEDDERHACACGWRRGVPKWGVSHSTYRMWNPGKQCAPVER